MPKAGEEKDAGGENRANSRPAPYARPQGQQGQGRGGGRGTSRGRGDRGGFGRGGRGRGGYIAHQGFGPQQNQLAPIRNLQAALLDAPPLVQNSAVRVGTNSRGEMEVFDVNNLSRRGGNQERFMAPTDVAGLMHVRSNRPEDAVFPAIVAVANSRTGEFGGILFPIDRAGVAARREENNNRVFQLGSNTVMEPVAPKSVRARRQNLLTRGEAEDVEMVTGEAPKDPKGSDGTGVPTTTDGPLTVPPGPLTTTAGPSTTPAGTTGPVCGICGSTTHVAMKCMQIDHTTGRIRGCPLCNTSDHILGDCAQYDALAQSDKLNMLVANRANMPEFTVRGGWFKATKEWIQENPTEIPAFFPWSVKFAKSQTKHLKELQKMFDEQQNHALLPIDPTRRTWDMVRVSLGSEKSALGQALQNVANPTKLDETLQMAEKKKGKLPALDFGEMPEPEPKPTDDEDFEITY